MNTGPTDRELITLATSLQQANPSLSRTSAMAEAIRILTGAEEVVLDNQVKVPPTQKPPVSKSLKKPIPVPEHILRNKARVRKAAEERKRTGGKLAKVHIVSGGKVSPK